ncbi:MAG: hypothetical protein RLZZ129_149, partial [Verrucomicrobiota bacterium]
TLDEKHPDRDRIEITVAKSKIENRKSKIS